MDRFRLVSVLKFAFCGVFSLSLLTLAGCNWLSVAMYAINPNDIPAKFDGLEDKRVVVVCRPVVELQFSDSTVPRDLTHDVYVRLANRVKKIKLVDEREVMEWTDENSWHDFAEVGKALKADMVVGIDLEQFSLYQGQTLYQGTASLNVSVHDMRGGGQRVFSQSMAQAKFPPHTPIPTAEKAESEFRRQFISVLAEQIGRNFYAHESRVDFASDSNLVQQ